MSMGGCAGGKVREGWYRWCHARICTYTRARFRENQILWQSARVQSSIGVADLIRERTENEVFVLHEIFHIVSGSSLLLQHG